MNETSLYQFSTRAADQQCAFKAEFIKNRFITTSQHTCITINRAIETSPFIEGDQVVLSFSFDEIFEITLVSGQRFENRYGQYLHDAIIGAFAGTKVYNDRGTGFVIPLKFQPSLHTEALKRRTQILFVPDISLIIGHANIGPGSIVVEAGIGSGSMSHFFLQTIAPTGKLYNFDLFEERVQTARQEFAKFSKDFQSKATDVLCNGFIDVPSNKANLVFLDLPTPEKCLNDVNRVLLKNGHLIVFLPCMEQVHQLLTFAYKNGFKGGNVQKVQAFGYEFDNRTLAALPIFRGSKNLQDYKKFTQLRKVAVGRTHTGYLVFMRRK